MTPGVLLFLLLLLLPAVFFPSPAPAGEAAGKVVTVFWRPGCAHCDAELEFLDDLVRREPGLILHSLNVMDKEGGRPLFDRLTRERSLPRVTPVTVVGRRVIVGFDTPEGIGREILEALETAPRGLDLPAMLDRYPPGENGAPAGENPALAATDLPREHPFRHVRVPFMGVVDLSRLTLPALSMVLGLVDGFNPCAMWVLVAFLTALAQAGSMKRMIQFAGIFILAQGIMYLVILNTWYLAFDFIAADRIVTPVIGLVAVAAGCFFLWEARRKDAECRVTSFEQRSRTLRRLNGLAQSAMGPAVVLAILGVALSVNVVEFACSIGIPQSYTKMLDLNEVGLAYREVLMGIYVFSYMLDDLAVFGVAIYSMDRIGITGKYSRFSNLVGGLLMLILGGMLIFRPEWLRF